MSEQHLLSPGPLLNEQGDLSEAGYAYSLVKSYDRQAISASPLRIKEWDYYYVGNRDYGVALTVADNGYMSMASISLLDFKKKQEKTLSKIGWFPKGKLHMPPTSKVGDLLFEGKGFSFSFSHAGEGKRRLLVHWADFMGKGLHFRCDILLQETSPNSMVIATPFKKKAHFYYNQKINNLRASGYAKVGETVYDFNQGSYGVLDWGRGVWTYKNTWYWGSLSAELDGVPFGWNFGYGFGDTSEASENMVFHGEKAYKLEDVIFDIPIGGGNRDDFMSPWTIRSHAHDMNIRFVPVIDRHADTNLLVLRSNQHQVFGRFSGYINIDEKPFEFVDLPGFAEKVFNKW